MSERGTWRPDRAAFRLDTAAERRRGSAEIVNAVGAISDGDGKGTRMGKRTRG
jgi:hypothetical protein